MNRLRVFVIVGAAAGCLLLAGVLTAGAPTSAGTVSPEAASAGSPAATTRTAPARWWGRSRGIHTMLTGDYEGGLNKLL